MQNSTKKMKKIGFFFSARRVGRQSKKRPNTNRWCLAVKMDCGDCYHEAQSGKSKRENRENNGHLVRKTFTPNKQTRNRIQILLQETCEVEKQNRKNWSGGTVPHRSAIRDGVAPRVRLSYAQVRLNEEMPDHVRTHEVDWKTNGIQ